MERGRIETLDQIDRMVSSIRQAEALRQNPGLNDKERELIDEWLDEPRYGGKVRSYESDRKSLELLIGYAREIAAVDSAQALGRATFAAIVAIIALGMALFILLR